MAKTWSGMQLRTETSAAVPFFRKLNPLANEFAADLRCGRLSTWIFGLRTLELNPEQYGLQQFRGIWLLPAVDVVAVMNSRRVSIATPAELLPVSSAGHDPTSLVVAMLVPPLGVLVFVVTVRGRTPTLPSQRFRNDAFKYAARLLLPYETLYYTTLIYPSERRKCPSFERIHLPENILASQSSSVVGLPPGQYSFCTWRKTLQAVAIALSLRDGKISRSPTCCLRKPPKNSPPLHAIIKNRDDTVFCKYTCTVRRGHIHLHTYTPDLSRSPGPASLHTR